MPEQSRQRQLGGLLDHDIGAPQRQQALIFAVLGEGRRRMPADPPSPIDRSTLDPLRQRFPHRFSPADRLQGDEDIPLERGSLFYGPEALVPLARRGVIIVEERRELGVAAMYRCMPRLRALVGPGRDVGRILQAPGPENGRQG